MILSRTSALDLIKNHDMVARIPAILPLVERYRQQDQTIVAAGKCKPCQRRAKLAPLGDEVLSFLIAQPPAAIDALRTRFNNDPHLYVYDPAHQGQKLVELGASSK
jgi:hypothetical protein